MKKLSTRWIDLRIYARFIKEKKLSIFALLAFLVMSFNLSAHTWEVRVNQNQDGTLTWYLQTYHTLSEVACVTQANQSGLIINGIQYPIQQVFSGDISLLSPTIFGLAYTSSRGAYGVINTPFLGTTLNVQPYSNVACWTNAGINANGTFVPPPPPVCSTCPVTGFSNVMAAAGNDNGTLCNSTDDHTTATITVNHLICANITGDGMFSVVFDPGGINTTYGPFAYSNAITTNVTINIPYGTSNTTQVKVVDADFGASGCNVQHSLTIPGGQYLGENNNAAPTISNCPQTQYQQIYTDANACSKTFAYSPTITGTPAPTVTYTFTGATIGSGSGTGSGSAFSTGQTTVNITATNACGTSNCSFVVTVIDNVLPNAITQNKTVYLNAAGQASIVAQDVNNGSNDNCGPVTLSLQNTGTICAQAAENQYAVLQAPVGTVITSIDFASYGTPIGTCGNYSLGWCHSVSSVNQVQSYALGQNAASIPAANYLFGDPCGGTVKRLFIQATYSGGNTPSNSFNCTKVGNNTVYLNVTDQNGNVSTASAIVTVLDTIHPVINCQPNIVVNATSASGAQVAYTAPVGTDNCISNTVRTAGFASGSIFPIGTTTVTHRVTDASGLFSECSFAVTVNAIAPSIVCPNSMSVNNTIGQCDGIANFAATEATGIPASTITYSANSGSVFPNGLTTVTATATNVAGASSCTFNVTVIDNELPTINCPGNIAVNNTLGMCGANVNYAVTASDNCNSNTGSNYIQSSKSYAPIDMTGNTFLLSGDDNIQGPFVLPFNFNFYGSNFNSLYASTNGFLSFTFPGVGQGCCAGQALPNCNFQNSVALGWTDWITTVIMKVSGTAPNRVVTLQWNGSEYGNSGAVLGQISLYETTNEIRLTTTNINTVNPYHVITQGLNKDCATAHPVVGRNAQNWVATNECIAFSPGISPQLISGIASGGYFPIGTTTNTYSVTDLSNNTSTCTFDVVVTDNEAPMITCPASITVNCQDDNTSTSTGIATATDNCPSVSIAQNDVSTQDANVANVGHYNYTIARTWTATDASNNASSCLQTITVQDVTNPVITCPASVTVNCQDDNTSASTGVATGTDNCSAVAITETTSSTQDANAANVGHYNYVITRTWTATDVSGNSSTCDQIITVQDVTNPVITCPASVTVNCQDDNTSASTGVATGTDNCSAVTITETTSSTQDANVANVGHYNYVITRTWTATDVSGNSSTCDQIITVQDVTNPVITCPASVTVNCQDDNTSASTGVATGTDNCSVVAITETTSSTQDANAANVGHYNYVITRTWTAIDVSGNSSTCDQIITVQDVTNPVITCPANINVNNDATACGATVIFAATATDICSPTTITYSPISGSFFNVGTTTVIATAMDVSGNTSTCNFTVTVNDNETPVAICKNYSLNLSSGTGTVVAANINNGSHDNCAIASMSVSPNTFTCANAGQHVVTLTVTDIHGNSSSCQSIVTVQYQPSCSINVIPANNTYTGGVPSTLYLGYGSQSATMQSVAIGGAGFTYSWSPSTNLSNTNTSNPTFTATTQGTTTYTVTITNSNGCTTSCTKTMCVIDARSFKKGVPDGKVNLCHVPPGNANNPQNINISVNAVDAHLTGHAGDQLGTCGQVCGAMAKTNVETVDLIENEAFETLVYPNPNNGEFTIEVQLEHNVPVLATMYDMLGKKIADLKGIVANTPYKVSQQLANGVYFIHIEVDGHRQSVRIIKQD